MFIIVFLCGLAVTQAQNLQVNTTEGLIDGNRASTGDYYVFYGIPYAAPPVGENRFKVRTIDKDILYPILLSH